MEVFDDKVNYELEAPVSQDEIEIVDDPAIEEKEIIFTHMLPGEFDIQRGPQMSQEDIRLYNASLVLEYGQERDPNIKLRLIVGTSEINKPPGRNPGEFSAEELELINSRHGRTS